MPARPRNNRTPDGAKKRWSADDRARRAEPGRRPADPAADTRAGRRAAQFGPQDGGRGEGRRTDWYPGPRTPRRQDDRFGRDRDGRPARDSRSDRGDSLERTGRGDRPFGGAADGRGDRPYRAGREDRPYRSDRGDRPYGRADRTDRADGPRRGDGGERAFRDDRDRAPRSFDRDRAPRSFEGARADRAFQGDRAERASRPYGDRTDRPARPFREDRGDRPHSFREDRDARPRSFREDRGDRGPRQDRVERPFRGERGDRPSRDRLGGDRPARAARDGAPRAFREDRPRRDDRAPRFDERRAGRDDRTPRRDDAQRWEAQEDVVLERLEAEVVTAAEVAGASFADLGLGQQITRALADLGATTPFPIQAATIPPALAGRNVLGRGRTGSGKTIAFGAALVERLMRNWAESGRSGSGRRMGRPPRALILAPTRELALQIDRTVQPIARAVGLFTTQIVGGVPQGRQVGALGKGVDIVIGTPGRIEDLLEQGRLDLAEVEIAVLDEADHMADLGFLEPMQRLLRRVPDGGQRMLFSATLDTAVAQLVDEFLPDPAVHEVADPEGGGTADHRVLVIDQGQKLPVLTALVAASDRALVFARTRAFAEQLADDLDGEGVRAESLHGDLNQARRTRNLARFSEGRVSALVATDVAARGIHVDGVDLVVHADSAEEYKTYLHRSGRTGRAGASGTVVTLITARRRRRFTELLERAGVEAEFTVLHEGDDPVAAIGR